MRKIVEAKISDGGSRRRVSLIWWEEIDRRVHSTRVVEGFRRRNRVVIRNGIIMVDRMFGVTKDMVNMVQGLRRRQVHSVKFYLNYLGQQRNYSWV